jgi:hypothetical protein
LPTEVLPRILARTGAPPNVIEAPLEGWLGMGELAHAERGRARAN